MDLDDIPCPDSLSSLKSEGEVFESNGKFFHIFGSKSEFFISVLKLTTQGKTPSICSINSEKRYVLITDEGGSLIVSSPLAQPIFGDKSMETPEQRSEFIVNLLEEAGDIMPLDNKAIL